MVSRTRLSGKTAWEGEYGNVKEGSLRRKKKTCVCNQMKSLSKKKAMLLVRSPMHSIIGLSWVRLLSLGKGLRISGGLASPHSPLSGFYSSGSKMWGCLRTTWATCERHEFLALSWEIVP